MTLVQACNKLCSRPAAGCEGRRNRRSPVAITPLLKPAAADNILKIHHFKGSRKIRLKAAAAASGLLWCHFTYFVNTDAPSVSPSLGFSWPPQYLNHRYYTITQGTLPTEMGS